MSYRNPTTGAFTHFAATNPKADHKTLATDWITVVEIGSSGAVWTGGDGGLSRIDPSTNAVETIATEIKPGVGLNIISLFEGEDGELWIGTDLGLFARGNGKTELRPVRDPTGQSGLRIQDIIDDEEGHVWISTNKGLSRIEPGTGEFWNFTEDDGLQGSAFRRRAAWRKTDGELLFGGSRGFDRFYPATLTESRDPAPVVFTELRINGETVSPGEGSPLARSIAQTNAISLAHDQTSLSVAFAALNMTVSTKNRYRYRLDDGGRWIDAPVPRIASFANLEPGEYTLQVLASNHDGLWNEEPAVLAISIDAPWWFHPYAFALYIIAGCVALVAASRIGARVQSARADRLEKTVELRTVELKREIEARAEVEHELFQAEMESALRRSQKLEAVGKLAGGIAHDFNNLLGIVLGNLDFLRRMAVSDNNEPATRRVETAIRAADRGAQLTRQLLGFASRSPAAVTAVDIGKIVNDMEVVIRQAAAAEVECEISSDDDLWPVQIDRGELEDALLNMAINARDAMPDGGRLIIDIANIRIEAEDAIAIPNLSEGDYVRIRVVDTGEGIPSEIKDKIFDPFFTTKPEGEGTGLGLSTVYGFAQRYGGAVTLESEVGRGAEFNIYLPRSDAPASGANDKGQIKSFPVGTEEILIVEDERDLREIASSWLTECGYEVSDAANSDEALEVLASRPTIRLVFTDIIMPGGKNGLDLAMEVRQIRPDVRIILTTGYSGGARIASRVANENLPLIRKPYSKRDIAWAIRDSLDNEGSEKA